MLKLTRPFKFWPRGQPLEATVTLAPGETKEARFASWLTETTAKPQFCCHHAQTQLVVCSASRQISQVYRDRTNDGSYDPFREPEMVPGTFAFKVEMRCPTCRCAYALCPPEFHTMPLETFGTSTAERAKALAVSRDFVNQVDQNRCGCALFVGPPGTGKTRLACGIVRELDNHEALYVRQGQLLCELRATYSRKDVILHPVQGSDDDDTGQDQTPTPLEITQDADFLVLDEIGCTPLARDERLFLDELLKHRYDHRKPMILISNLPLTGTPQDPGLKELLGDALADRIKDATGNGKFIVQFSGESYRRTTGQKYLEGLG